MDILEVNKETCDKDGICASVCPAGLIDFEKGDYPKPIPEAEEVCIRCGHCVVACPTGSLSHRVMSAEQCDLIKDSLNLSLEQTEQFLKGRRSIRAYKEKMVPRDVLEKLIEIARYAPTGHNSQSVEWLVLSDRVELHNLAEITVEWMRWLIDNMPEFAAEMNLGRVVKRWEEGIDVILRNAPAVIVAHAEEGNRMAPTNCVIALTYLELAATGMGLGCCWAGFFNGAANNFPPMMDVFPLPEGRQCFGAMMLGYPKYGYQRIPKRKPSKIIWRM